MQFYKHNTSRDGTHKQVGGRSVDAALFAEELVEIYSTPPPKGWCEAKKVIGIDWLDVFYNSRGPIFIPGT